MSWSAARVGLLAGAVMLAAGCSGDNDASAETVAPTTVVSSTAGSPGTTAPPPESTTTPTTATTTTTTTVAPATAAPESTAPPTSTPTVTTAPEGVPPRVTFPDDPDKQAVVDAAYAFVDALRAAVEFPADLDLRVVLASTVSDPLAGRVTGYLDSLVEAGERVVASESSPTYVEVWAETVLVYPGNATFEACAVDSDIRVGVGPDGSEVTVDDDISSGAQTYSLDLVDGRWRVSDIERYGQWEGQVGCG